MTLRLVTDSIADDLRALDLTLARYERFGLIDPDWSRSRAILTAIQSGTPQDALRAAAAGAEAAVQLLRSAADAVTDASRGEAAWFADELLQHVARVTKCAEVASR